MSSSMLFFPEWLLQVTLKSSIEYIRNLPGSLDDYIAKPVLLPGPIHEQEIISIVFDPKTCLGLFLKQLAFSNALSK